MFHHRLSCLSCFIRFLHIIYHVFPLCIWVFEKQPSLVHRAVDQGHLDVWMFAEEGQQQKPGCAVGWALVHLVHV